MYAESDYFFYDLNESDEKKTKESLKEIQGWWNWMWEFFFGDNAKEKTE
jgi:hypothetical protein